MYRLHKLHEIDAISSPKRLFKKEILLFQIKMESFSPFLYQLFTSNDTRIQKYKYKFSWQSFVISTSISGKNCNCSLFHFCVVNFTSYGCGYDYFQQKTWGFHRVRNITSVSCSNPRMSNIQLLDAFQSDYIFQLYPRESC